MNRIRELRLLKNINQNDIAESLNISQAALSNWERNVNDPDVKHLRKLAQLFDVSIDYILCISDLPVTTKQMQDMNIHYALLEDYEMLDEEDRKDLHKMASRMMDSKRLRDIAGIGS